MHAIILECSAAALTLRADMACRIVMQPGCMAMQAFLGRSCKQAKHPEAKSCISGIYDARSQTVCSDNTSDLLQLQKDSY